MIYSPKTAGLITRLNLGNVGSFIEASAEANVLTGQMVFDREYFADQAAPLDLIVVGQVVVQPDVPAEDIERGLDTLSIVGQLICPKPLQGLLQSKMQHLIGQTVTYTPSSRLFRCTSGQMGAIQARLGLSEGELQDSTAAETPDEGMGNVGHLVL